MEEKHEEFMRQCIKLAQIAKLKGKTAVGALIIRNEKVIAEGIEGLGELPAVLAHAEIIAIEKAVSLLGTKDLSGCKLYTTVEPCFMCSYLIRETKIDAVIYGAKAGEIGGFSSEYPILVGQNIKKWITVPIVIGGVLEEDCLKLLARH
jgi:tRNA(adenine34) deaminase